MNHSLNLPGCDKEVDILHNKSAQQNMNIIFNIFICSFIKRFKKLYFVFRERVRKRERMRNIYVREKHLLVASLRPPVGDLAHNPGTSPNWNQTGDLQFVV